MMAVFMIANPTVFTTWYLYSSVLTTLPVALFVVVPLVFVVTCGEIDLSFPATMGFASWVFALVVQAGYDPFLGIAAAIATGMLLGFLVGVAGRLWRAVVADRHARHELPAARPDPDHQRGQVDGADRPRRQLGLHDLLQPGVGAFPVQIFWALAFVVLSALLYNRHRFGAQVKVVGDNPDSAQQMGIDVKRVRVKVFVFVGIGAAIAGTFSVMINFTWWPTAGDGYLLPVLASVFVGGTPTWGGIGTVVGGAIGAVTVSFIQTGVVAAGLSGFYVQFFNGLIIILSLLGHRWNQARYR